MKTLSSLASGLVAAACAMSIAACAAPTDDASAEGIESQDAISTGGLAAADYAQFRKDLPDPGLLYASELHTGVHTQRVLGSDRTTNGAITGKVTGRVYSVAVGDLDAEIRVKSTEFEPVVELMIFDGDAQPRTVATSRSGSKCHPGEIYVTASRKASSARVYVIVSALDNTSADEDNAPSVKTTAKVFGHYDLDVERSGNFDYGNVQMSDSCPSVKTKSPIR